MRIDMNMSFTKSLVDASRRIDGIVMLLASLLAIVIVVVDIFYKLFPFIHVSSGKGADVIWWFVPIIEYVLYIRLRQFDFCKGRVTEIINSIILAMVPGMILVY